MTQGLAQSAATASPIDRPIAAAAAPITRRLLGAFFASGAATLLGLAAWLTPSSAGLGTHEQLRLPACQWVTLMDLPCPTCGMTTAFAHAADGNFLSSFLTQPMGFVLALAAAMTLIVGSYVAATGSPIGGMLGRYLGARTGWIIGGCFLLAWVYKILSFKGVL